MSAIVIIVIFRVGDQDCKCLSLPLYLCSDSPHSEPGTIDEADNGTEPHTSEDGEWPTSPHGFNTGMLLFFFPVDVYVWEKEQTHRRTTHGQASTHFVTERDYSGVTFQNRFSELLFISLRVFPLFYTQGMFAIMLIRTSKKENNLLACLVANRVLKNLLLPWWFSLCSERASVPGSDPMR